MNKTCIKSIAVFIMAIGIIMMSCDNPSGKDRNDGSFKGDILSNALVYEKVIAQDGMELIEYLSSTNTAYEITLEIKGQNVYFNTDVSITMPMRIVGDPNNIVTINTSGSEGSYYCLDIAANLELRHCNIKAHDRAVLASGIEFPPLAVRTGTILTVGEGAGLTLMDFPYSMDFSGGTVIVKDGGKFIDDSVNGYKIFDCGISYLVIDETGTANLSKTRTVGVKESDQFQIVNGTFDMWRSAEETGYVVDGIVHLNSDWVLPEGHILHIKSGNLIVQGSKLTVAKGAGVVLDGNIELSANTILDLGRDASEAMKNFDGSGFILVEESGTGLIYRGTDVFIGIGNNTVFEPSPTARIELSGKGISLKSKGSGSVVNLLNSFTLPQGKTLLVESNVTMDVRENFILSGGTLDVRGVVEVKTSNKGIINDGGKINVRGGRVDVANDGYVIEIKQNITTD